MSKPRKYKIIINYKKPCIHHGNTPRYGSNNQCILCKYSENAAYRARLLTQRSETNDETPAIAT